MDSIIVPDCIRCGNEIDLRLYIKSSRTRKYCGRLCQNLHKTIVAIESKKRNCKNCGVLFSPKKKATLFCEHSCAKDFARAKPRSCNWCNSIFTPLRWAESKKTFVSDAAGKREFCTHECRRNKLFSGRHVKCLGCENQFTPLRYDSRYKMFGPNDSVRVCSQECQSKAFPISEENKRKTSERFSGNKHPAWRGGGKRTGFRGHEWIKIAEAVRIKAGRCCEHCGKTEIENGRRLDVNHKKPFHQFNRKELANKMSNLEALCRSCHQQADWLWRKNNPVQLSIAMY